MHKQINQYAKQQQQQQQKQKAAVKTVEIGYVALYCYNK